MDRNKIKICHFTNIITGKSDGVYSHLKMIFKYADPNKFQQYLVFQGNPDIETEAKKLGIEILAIRSLTKKFSLKPFIEFYSFVKSNDIDIIHTHFLKPYAIAGLLNIILRKKIVYNYHGLFIENTYNSKIEQFIYRLIHRVINNLNLVELAIVPSFSSKKSLLNETRGFKKIKVYYNGYDNIIEEQPDVETINYFLRLKNSESIIGIVARIDAEKRIDLALEIAKKVLEIRKDVHFIILGNGNLERDIKNYLKNLSINDNVDLLGFIPNAKLYAKYFDLLLITSDREGLPLSIWEAMASKVPIVSTDVGGIREILDKEKCGLTYPRGDVEQGAKIILGLLCDKERREIMGQNGYDAIKKKYNTNTFADFFNDLYISLSPQK